MITKPTGRLKTIMDCANWLSTAMLCAILLPSCTTDAKKVNCANPEDFKPVYRAGQSVLITAKDNFYEGCNGHVKSYDRNCTYAVDPKPTYTVDTFGCNGEYFMATVIVEESDLVPFKGPKFKSE